MFQQSLVKIEDYQQVVTKTYSYISVSITNVVLNTSVDIQVMIYDSNQNMIDLKLLTLSGTDYTNWGNDDSYILNISCQKLGFTLATTSK
jgi:hypothetical protein